jgi:hypothetical protein
MRLGSCGKIRCVCDRLVGGTDAALPLFMVWDDGRRIDTHELVSAFGAVCFWGSDRCDCKTVAVRVQGMPLPAFCVGSRGSKVGCSVLSCG